MNTPENNKSCEDFRKACFTNDTKSLRKILSSNSEFSKHPKSRCEVESMILYEDNLSEDVIESLVIFLETGADCILDRYLKTAIIQQSLHRAELLLKNGAKLRGPVWENHSPAEFAFCATNIVTRKEMLSLLLKYGLDSGFKSEYGENLLHIFLDQSVGKNDHDALEITKILIDSGVSIREYTYDGFSIMSYCAETKNPSLMSFLIEEGVEIKLKDRAGWTALHYACEYHNEDLIRLLLRKGVEISPVNEEYDTPFSLLDPNYENYDACVKVMVEEFSKLYFERIPITDRDVDLIEADQDDQGYFEQCMLELIKMGSSRFHRHHTYYSLLKRPESVKILAKLTKNEEFLVKFQDFLDGLSIYKMEMRRILREAINIKNEMLIVYLRLCSVFGEFFPDIVIRNLTDNLTLNDLPLE